MTLPWNPQSPPCHRRHQPRQTQPMSRDQRTVLSPGLDGVTATSGSSSTSSSSPSTSTSSSSDHDDAPVAKRSRHHNKSEKSIPVHRMEFDEPSNLGECYTISRDFWYVFSNDIALVS
eukprot:TRINITY_DN18496_c0_g1_i1.p2 TRINITY_DN18496_c0_g1~~TRINITY_DN18496_c0_g1_i1.p2  ORF type:complete len:118 (+),score=12.26 TRINITY_DN18496_c0_g1_i1:410-763(+)